MLETSTVVVAPRKPTGRHHQPASAIQSRHPLDQLTGQEVLAVSSLCKREAAARGLPSPVRFNYITAQEPTKQDLLCYEKDQTLTLPRTALALIQLPTGSTVYEATVDLSDRPLLIGWDKLEGVQPTVTLDDCLDAEEVVKADPGIQKLLLERYGISDLGLVAVDPWYYGDRFAGDTLPNDARYIQCFLYTRSRPGDNHYAHPLDLLVFLDLNARRILQTFMHDTPPPIPQHDSNFHRDFVQEERGFRTGLKPLHIVQPQGPSFEVDGNLVSWQKWSMRVGFNWREGLVLHNIGYEDQERVRPVIHRASLAEIIVPYGDPRHPFERKCAFDIVDYGLGFSANSLELGCDCLGQIHYFDGMVNNKHGEPMVIKKAVCMHEEDAGILFKHMEYRDGSAEVRRSRRLVISFISTVVNYEYAFYWSFYQDGTIDYQIKLTGELSTNALSQHELAMGKGTYGTIVAPGVNAQNHQHMFCARLDFALDCEQGGRPLIVTETNTERLPVEENPFGNGFRGVERELRTELQAKRTADPLVGRTWKVKNPARINPVTRTPVGYKLMSTASPLILALPGSLLAKRGEFATANLWVTPHQDDERWPAGDYPAQHTGGQGLGKWTKQNRTVSGQDPVVWHAFGVLHYPRIEDFPIMPVEVTGFTLKPVNFFSGNPGIDIPPERNNASKAECCKEVSIANGNGGSSSKL